MTARNSRSVDRLSLKRARRIALAAQGFADRRPGGPVAARHLRRVFERVGLVQIDSVNVLVRSHYLPAFSRLGAYDPGLLDRQAYGRRKRLFEYWGHEASLVPIELQPHLRWRMARAERGEGIYKGLARFGEERRDYVQTVLDEIAARGPLGASELSDGGNGAGGWWGWSDGKRALEFLFWSGRITTARRRNFERVYDLTDRVLPAEIIEAPTPSDDEAQRHLIRVAARALGVATERDLREYFRLPVADSPGRIAELVEAGELLPVAVEGWRQPAYLDPAARMPRRVEARALLSPFDSLVWERERAERLFGFRYRIEIYTPAEKRIYGYYVLPFLLGERLVARVCLKADRAAATLRVNAAHSEADGTAAEIVGPLAEELEAMAAWLGLEAVSVESAGDLGRPLAAEFRSPGARRLPNSD